MLEYENFLKQLEEKYPHYCIGLYKLPPSSIKGIVNGFHTSRINLNDEKAVKKFFDNQPLLREHIEAEIKTK